MGDKLKAFEAFKKSVDAQRIVDLAQSEYERQHARLEKQGMSDMQINQTIAIGITLKPEDRSMATYLVLHENPKAKQAEMPKLLLAASLDAAKARTSKDEKVKEAFKSRYKKALQGIMNAQA